MRTNLLISLLLLSQSIWAQSAYEALEFLSVHQMETKDKKPFDLSGMVEVDDHIYVVADKNWNRFVYEIELSNRSFAITNKYELITNDELDLEAIDYNQGTFYLANEKEGKIYSLDADKLFSDEALPHTLDLDFEQYDLKPDSWGNAGWEGLAIDSSENRMYLIKERQPRFILPVDLSGMNCQPMYNIPESESGDFSDAKFEGGYLYILERLGNYIAKVDPETHEVVDKKHYRHIASHADGKLYGPEKYGMAETLMLTKDEIWIGLDNNGKEVTKHAIETYDLKGNTPVILKFKRPAGF